MAIEAGQERVFFRIGVKLDRQRDQWLVLAIVAATAKPIRLISCFA